MIIARIQRSTFACWMAMMLVVASCGAQGQHHTTLGRRALLAQEFAGGTSAACAAASSKQLLTNGYFKPSNVADLHNHLLMATLSNDVYPWAKQYNIHMLDVADGLNEQQLTRFQKLFGEKYKKLGATSIQFLDYYQTGDITGAAAHAAVLGTQHEVFVVIRGTADMGQVQITGRFESRPLTVFNTTLQIYYPAHQSFTGLWPKLLPAVRRAVAATSTPSTAPLYITGHSLGGASAYLAALMLKEQGFTIGGVWSFDPYKTGTTCSSDQLCWATLYEKHLADVTFSWWNNQDPIPLLVDAHFNTLNPMNASAWGHVPSNGKNWFRIAGSKCMPVTPDRQDLMEPCPPEVDAADGAADGRCPSEFGDHMPWEILKRVAHCALLQGQAPTPANMRVAMRPQEALSADTLACARSNVWTDLLQLPIPSGMH